jgi:hypothetical protein
MGTIVQKLFFIRVGKNFIKTFWDWWGQFGGDTGPWVDSFVKIFFRIFLGSWEQLFENFFSYAWEKIL